MDDSTWTTSFGLNKYLWGNVPAFDVLNLKDNEGATYGKDLRIYFGGRSLMQGPHDLNPQLKCVDQRLEISGTSSKPLLNCQKLTLEHAPAF
jgi:hypothetical protein